MKKIDLHIHTIPTISDSHFVFSLDSFKKYVKEANLDVVAITNHDIFNLDQFKIIRDELGISVFPGIEINLDKGHVLIIDDGSDLIDFDSKTNLVSQRIQKLGDYLSFEEIETIFGDLSKYLVIPHYDKRPSLSNETLLKLKSYISAGEVDSAKKFVRNIKDSTKLTPVLFSDTRIKEDFKVIPTRHTFIDCGEITLDAIKICLTDKAKVALSANDGNKLWQVFDDGQMLSTGLNILIGERSSGKTHTLNKLNSVIENVKYIEQFSLVQQNNHEYENEFKGSVEKKRSAIANEYLDGLKRIIDDIMKIDLEINDREVENYVASLIKSAEETDRNDAYSNSKLFSEVLFPNIELNTLKSLIESIRQVIENIEFKSIIEKHLDIKSLKKLACELLVIYWEKELENKKKTFANELIKDIKQSLKLRTSATQVEDVDLYKISMDRKRVERFIEVTNFLKKPTVISEENIQGFRVEARKEIFLNATDLKSAIGRNTSLVEAFRDYDNPYKYLRSLMGIESLNRSDLYKLFIKITYKILNKDGFEVSGGERSEFRLIEEISDAQKYDLLLIDEPESSFDNLFLKSDVNKILKKISELMPVVVVTHNSTVGASAGADYLLHTKKELEDGKLVYRVYSGYPSDKQLFSVDNKAISNHKIIMNSLEAGVDAYDLRRQSYEAIKN